MASANSSPIAENIELLSREKNIDPQTIIEAITEAVLKAYQKQYRHLGEDVDVRYNAETGQIEIFARMTVVEEVTDPAREISLEEANELVEGAEVGDILEIQRPFEGMGRIAAQVAKQVITQKVREAERQNIYDEYIQRVGELVHGFVKRFEKRGDIIVDLGSVEALLPRSEQSKAEKFSLNERIRAVIIKVTKEVKETHGQQIILSRTCPELLIRLFEMEVPEIYDGTVQIKGAVREPGERAKIAVTSIDRDVDPVGACVGMKGSRVQAVIRELHGEKIDIIEWSENPAIFVANALSPAKVNKVQIIDPVQKKIEVIVEDDQLSLAIGKQGQNVRLAARLVGWNIDIRSESDVKREVASQIEQLISPGATPLKVAEAQLGADMVHRLTAKGYATLEELAEADLDELAEKLDISLDRATQLKQSAQSILASQSQEAEQAAAPSPQAEPMEAPVGESASTEIAEATAPSTEASPEEAVAHEPVTPSPAPTPSPQEASVPADQPPGSGEVNGEPDVGSSAQERPPRVGARADGSGEEGATSSSDDPDRGPTPAQAEREAQATTSPSELEASS
ncbi:MAG: transcription termination/antitermination protein NusA [Acidobacteria bacterium]|nr:MAG: transcription termination/antitermination protein NusA [Acidobacteriota bacterium]